MQTPILDMLKNYAQQKYLRFHMPGHKGGADDDFFDHLFACDITELDFSDNLLQPTGVIKQAQDLFANAVGAQNCFFVTNGSTCGVLSMVSASKGKLLVERASHASVFNALQLLGKDAIVVNNKMDDGRFLPVTLQQIKNCVLQHNDIKTILLTSPNYYGECCNLDEIYEFCKNKGILLFVDGAHGAHFGFGKLLPKSIAKSCDACVTSTHKTLPALTQTACVFAKDSVAEQIKQYINVFNSSSPNYLLLASIDFARAYMQKQAKDGCDKNTFDLINEIKTQTGHSFLQNDDFSRLVLVDTNGIKASEWLKNNGVYVEFCDSSRVVMIVSVAEKIQNLLKLKDVLMRMPQFEKPHTKDVCYHDECCKIVNLCGDVQLVDINDAEGRVCAQQCGGYPPCIPLFLRGEKITNADRLLGFADTFGLCDKKIKVFKK